MHLYIQVGRVWDWNPENRRKDSPLVRMGCCVTVTPHYKHCASRKYEHTVHSAKHKPHAGFHLSSGGRCDLGINGKAHHCTGFSSSLRFPICSARVPPLLARSGRSAFTTEKARQGRRGGKETVGLLNRWTELVPLARASFRPCAQSLPRTPLSLNSSSECCFLKLSEPFSKPEGGTAGSGRRVVESHCFNSSHHELSHLSVNARL